MQYSVVTADQGYSTEMVKSTADIAYIWTSTKLIRNRLNQLRKEFYYSSPVICLLCVDSCAAGEAAARD